jgi:hypothetical protein
VTFTPSGVGSRSATLYLTSNAPGSPHTVPLTGTGTDFGLAAQADGSTSATVNAGGTATYNLQVAPTGFSGPVALACAFQGSTPRGASCAVLPGSVTVNGTDPAPFTVSVATTARTLATPQIQAPPPAETDWGRHALPLLMALVMLAILAAAAPRFIRAHGGLKFAATGVVLAATLLVLLAWAACGGGGGGGGTTPTPTGTAAGTYTLTVTGTAGGASRTTGLSLTVS